MREQYVEAVFAVVTLIPPGRVLSYGDIASLLDSGGPRQIGAAMAQGGGDVPWWRVIRADGTAPLCHEGRALRHYRGEGTALCGDVAELPNPGHRPGWRVDFGTARWNPSEQDLELLDAIAARLHAADHAVAAPAAQGTSMSVPRAGLEL